ncbi:spherulin-1A [Colletotrichum eremochloae]|nr:spherulin-1A [Colletotrichum eremochloae]
MIIFSMMPKGLSLLLLCLHFVGTNAMDDTLHPELVRLLRTSPTELDKTRTLSDDQDWTFNYFVHRHHTHSPGATVGNGMIMAWICLGPCAMLPPHYHARASNYVVSVMESTETFMTLENGARVVRTKLVPGMMTVFPQGGLHTTQNTGCVNATLISALSSEDAGTQNVANGLFDLPLSVVAAAFGGSPLSAQFAQLRRDIPVVGTGASMGTTKCIQRCEASGYKYVSPSVRLFRNC